ncbi:AAA family ATPase [Streptomyces sp. NPDC014986]|uniref:AAA family ATPase n=1 Tax=Streptomyces sp. NPDC014986 TaxID=3364934 RepID=UPI003701F65A
MSAPLTPPPPPHEHSARDAWQPPSDGPAAVPFQDSGSTGHPGGWYGQDGPGMRTELREAAVTALATALAGVLLGVLWWWLAPRVPLVGDVVGDDWVVYFKDSEGEQAVGVDGTFSLLATGFGALCALVAFLLRRRGGVPLVVALAFGGLLGSLLAWRIGVWLGPAQDVIAQARSVGKGVTFDAPLKLSAKGALLVWPFAVLVAHLGLTGLFGPRDPDPAPGPYAPDAAKA